MVQASETEAAGPSWVLQLSDEASREFASIGDVLQFADDNGDALAILFPSSFEVKQGDETVTIIRTQSRHMVLISEANDTGE